jgi:hypothetical protein
LRSKGDADGFKRESQAASSSFKRAKADNIKSSDGAFKPNEASQYKMEQHNFDDSVSVMLQELEDVFAEIQRSNDSTDGKDQEFIARAEAWQASERDEKKRKLLDAKDEKQQLLEITLLIGTQKQVITTIIETQARKNSALIQSIDESFTMKRPDEIESLIKAIQAQRTDVEQSQKEVYKSLDEFLKETTDDTKDVFMGSDTVKDLAKEFVIHGGNKEQKTAFATWKAQYLGLAKCHNAMTKKNAQKKGKDDKKVEEMLKGMHALDAEIYKRCRQGMVVGHIEKSVNDVKSVISQLVTKQLKPADISSLAALMKRKPIAKHFQAIDKSIKGTSRKMFTSIIEEALREQFLEAISVQLTDFMASDLAFPRPHNLPNAEEEDINAISEVAMNLTRLGQRVWQTSEPGGIERRTEQQVLEMSEASTREALSFRCSVLRLHVWKFVYICTLL